MADPGGRLGAELEELAAWVRFVPIVRYLEAVARAADGTIVRRPGHRGRRRDGGRLWRACIVRRWMVQSLLALAFYGISQILRRTPTNFGSFTGSCDSGRRISHPRQELRRCGVAARALRRGGRTAGDRLGFVSHRESAGGSRGQRSERRP